MKKMLFSVVLGCLMMGSAWGAITYVDAELGNTTIGGTTPVPGVNYSTDYSNVTDNLWGWRTNRTDVNGAGVWVTDGGAFGGVVDLEATAPLRIDITLPEAGVYDLYAVIMNNESGDGRWDVGVRIGDFGVFTTFNKYSEAMTQALASDFAGTVKVSGGGDMTFKVMIGQYTTTTANETVSIYINGLDAWDGQAGLDQRTRFDGIGYETAPDPLPWAVNVAPFDGNQSVLGMDTLLEWLAGPDAAGHRVYLGTDESTVAFKSDLNGSRHVDLEDLAIIAGYWLQDAADIFTERLDIDHSGVIDIGEISSLANDWLLSEDRTFMGGFSAEMTSYNAGALSPDTTYYWRIDEVGDQTVYKGDVWEFKTFKADGLTARIYNNADLSDLKVTRIDSQVNFDWGSGSPDASVDVDTFSVSWEGGFMVPQEGEYTFYTNSDDGIRLYVNDILIIDKWIDQGVTEHSGWIYLRPGTACPIRLEYYDNGGSALVSLLWSGPGITKQVVPTAYLASTLTVNQPKDIWVVDLNSLPMAMRLLTLSLQGLVAKDTPAILVKQGGLTSFIREDMEAEGTVFHDNASVWWLVNKFIDHIDGLILCGSDLESINGATSLCGPMNAIAVQESILEAVQSRTGLPVLVDARGLTELDIYNTYKDLFGHETMVDVDKVDFLRDISITRNAFTYYDVDSTTRKAFIAGLTSQGTVLGWGNNAEFGWVKDVSQANAGGVPADWCKNLSTLSKLRVEIPKPPRRYPAPVQEGQRIVAFSMSDGDNLQIMAGGAITDTIFFGHPARGTFPMSWEFPPSMAEFNPRGVRSFYGEANTGDNLDCMIAGPSGHGYAFHYYLPDRRGYAKNTGQAMQKCGLTVASMINDNSGSLSNADQLLERPEILGVAYKDWVPYDRRNGAIYWHNGKPAVSYKCILWDGLGSPEEVAAEIAAMPSSPATDAGSYAMVNANAWSFGDIGGPMQAIVNTIEMLPANTRLVTVEELMILLRNNFGDPVTQEEYNAM
jgi:hypothetical protein